MEIKEIEGKKFVEYKQAEAERKRMIIQVSFLIAIIISCAVIIFALKTIITDIDLIGKDPLSYGMKQHDFISCQCFDSNRLEWYSEGGGFITQSQAGYGGEWNGAG
jgi:hypothetical protein